MGEGERKGEGRGGERKGEEGRGVEAESYKYTKKRVSSSILYLGSHSLYLLANAIHKSTFCKSIYKLNRGIQFCMKDTDLKLSQH